ncbi:lipid-A-disaccharide synthase [Sunxiuqinia sp. A32]|uniref:lipid-A-disaccharide synthase n=1 Tax=Sunxiuqinia sp. A32 TaxID=3461496 RepID=UPI004045BFEA
MKYYFIAGEASGDLHAANLIKELVKKDSNAELKGFGGDLMEQAGMKLTKHYKEMAFMGFIPVLMNLRTIKKNFKTCEEDLLNFKPDVVVLVDYPGFNLRMAEFAKKHGIRVYYYISPKIWAWKKHRIKKIRAFVDELFTILPFETEFYKGLGVEVNYVGNPVLDAILSKLKPVNFDSFVQTNALEKKPVIALLPGSRLQEIKTLLPIMLKAAEDFKDYQLVVTAAPNIDQTVYDQILKGYHVKLLKGVTYEVLQHAKAAILASGTVSLEAGVIRTPQIVCYKMAGGFIFHLIGRLLIKIQWASLVNLILNREAVKEFIQIYCTSTNIRQELKLILEDKNHRKNILASYDELHEKLGKTGASERAAVAMLNKLSQNY